MTQGKTELDPLFGLLALQNDLIDRDALVAAFQAWSRDKSRSLDDHLVERGGLEAADREAVEALVARHLRRHGNDPEQSLASLPADPSLRALWTLANGQPGDLAAALERVGTATEAAPAVEDGEATATYAVGSGTGTGPGGRFILLRPHARGGIGQVGVALDTELNREVALKEIQPRLADDPGSRLRFLLEAELTGRLEHPGVVPVYGLGADAKGRPYYAMRLIRGDSLKQAIERFHAADARPGRNRSERTLAFRELLNRFVAVCNAVAYAHNRGVIHRDLKPANVMLGPYGETLVVDWGLAKVVGREAPTASPEATLRPATGAGSGSSDTQAGTAIGTPAYMSPEQAEGRLDETGPASDIYGLGATLYCLLTGKPPIESDDVATVLRRAQQGDFPAPRQVARNIPAGLEAITLRAMSRNPADRYASARLLADDVEHWLADEPVLAYREPALERAARWTRQHRPLVTGAAVFLISAVAALSAGLVLVSQSGARIDQQRRRAEANLVEMHRQRDLARANSQLARRAVDENFVQVSENSLLKTLSGLQPLRKQLLESALKYYKEFVRLGASDPAVKTELAQAYLRVGTISAELGSPAESLASLQQGLGLYESLLRDDPANPTLRGDLARLHRALGRTQAMLGNAAEAIASFRKAIAEGEQVTRDHPEMPQPRHDLAMAYNNLGSMLHRVGQPAAGRRSYQQAIATWDPLIREHPAGEFQVGLGLAYSNLGWQLALAGRLDEALEAARKAVALCETVVRQDGSNPVFRNRLFGALDNLGTVCYFAGRADEGRENFERALAVAVPLARENPAVVEFQENTIAVYNDLGHLLLHSGRDDEARRSFEAALERAKHLPEGRPSQFSYAYIRRGLGKLDRRAGRREAALTSLQEAVRIGETSPGEKPYSAHELASARALCSALIGDGKTELTDFDRAAQRRYADQAIDALREAVAGGWLNLPWMKTDTDLDPLRARADFQALMAEVETRRTAPD